MTVQLPMPDDALWGGHDRIEIEIYSYRIDLPSHYECIRNMCNKINARLNYHITGYATGWFFDGTRISAEERFSGKQSHDGG